MSCQMELGKLLGTELLGVYDYDVIVFKFGDRERAAVDPEENAIFFNRRLRDFFRLSAFSEVFPVSLLSRSISGLHPRSRKKSTAASSTPIRTGKKTGLCPVPRLFRGLLLPCLLFLTFSFPLPCVPLFSFLSL